MLYRACLTKDCRYSGLVLAALRSAADAKAALTCKIKLK